MDGTGFVATVKCYGLGLYKALLRPLSLYRDIERGARYSSGLCVLVYGLIYVAASLWLYFNGFTPFFESWIRLPDDLYYLVQSAYILPLILSMWILATGILHGMSRLFHGRGRVEVLFRMTGYSLWAPWYILIVFDCLHSIPEILYNGVLVLCMVLMIAGTAAATRIEEKIGLLASILSTLTAVAVITVMSLTYIL